MFLGRDSRYQGGKEYYVKTAVIHQDRNKEMLRNDIAMITLTTEIQFSPTIQPAPLPTGEQRAIPGDKAGTYLGWGTLMSFRILSRNMAGL